MKPNLFQFATSELSQDAILCWLAGWADPDSAAHDGPLHRLGQAFLKVAFEKHGKQVPVIRTPIKITKQHRGIDVLLVINDAIAVCIEDKVGTTEHSDQLQRYLAGLKEEGFSEDQILPVYVQTGEQDSYRAVKAAGYGVVRRRELITLLSQYLNQGGLDTVARDFHDYLADIERRVEAFRTQPLSEWEWYAWQGFYSEIQHRIGDGEWSYVANPSGGFLGYWWHWHTDAESEQYLQIEQGNLCFKISVDEAAKRPALRLKWLDSIRKAGRDKNFPVARPQRLGVGQTMTVAVFDGEFRTVDHRGCLDIDATLGVLREAADVLDLAVAAVADKTNSAAAADGWREAAPAS
ncbi:MAG: PD-(D/E)XK nuclease family protein [Nitrospirales bacterium]